ncbi:hypothetical protein [Chondromyces apiculatus]|uniref:Uncharacterized protein n=1 Tax=Chondromyces apiculatus DSM 436 TaxID=1192034 RepID=A0A017SX87_9BACT|nr:hypothetical protein [Chondromyces apiculatus]EYF00936.1 Hypothetical protein CAP_8884 [Chondromyces apiculatus DSM 436]
MRGQQAARKAPKPRLPDAQFAHLSDQERRALKELAEVERAIAILEGRSEGNAEDLAFARKEAERLRDAVTTALDRVDHNMREARRARIHRALGATLLVGAIAAGAFLILPRARSYVSARATMMEAVDKAAAPFLREGFELTESSSGKAPLTVAGERGRCYVAIAGAESGTPQVRVERGPVSVEGNSVGLCGCGMEPLIFSVKGGEGVELRVLAAPVAVTGGADLLHILPTPPEARVAESADRRCAEEGIDAFITAHPPAGAGEARETRVEALGLRRVASAPASTPLVVLPAVKETCFLAQSDDPDDALSLRLPGGERPIQKARGAIVACGRALEGVSVWREGRGELTVFSAPARLAGGLLGMRELATLAGRTAEVWTPPDDHTFDAEMTLIASGLGPLAPGESATTPPKGEAPAAPGAYALFLAASTDKRSLLDVPDKAPDTLCRPPVHIGVAHGLCLETRPGALGDPGSFPPGTARAKRPSWLPVVRGNRAQQERALDVLAFARRMAVSGFELTSLTGFVEIPGGIEVTGRSGEKEIVALVLSQSPPYVYPLTDGPAWTLSGDPQVIQLPAGKSVKLKAVPPLLGPRSSRETILWRR